MTEDMIAVTLGTVFVVAVVVYGYDWKICRLYRHFRRSNYDRITALKIAWRRL